jgi:hypothetical protein
MIPFCPLSAFAKDMRSHMRKYKTRCWMDCHRLADMSVHVEPQEKPIGKSRSDKHLA